MAKPLYNCYEHDMPCIPIRLTTRTVVLMAREARLRDHARIGFSLIYLVPPARIYPTGELRSAKRGEQDVAP